MTSLYNRLLDFLQGKFVGLICTVVVLLGVFLSVNNTWLRVVDAKLTLTCALNQWSPSISRPAAVAAPRHRLSGLFADFLDVSSDFWVFFCVLFLFG